MRTTPPGAPGATRTRPLSVVAMVLAVVGPILAAPLAWRLFSVWGSHCGDAYVPLVALSFLLLIIPSIVGVALAHIGLYQARAGDRAAPAPGTGIAAVAVAWVLFAVTAAGGGFVAFFLMVFSEGAFC